MPLILRLRCNGTAYARNAATIFQLLSALTFINARFALVASTLSPDLTIDNVIDENYANAVSSLTNDAMNKRTWQQINSAWGKRTAPIDGWNVVEPTADDDALLAERWIPVFGADGGTGGIAMSGENHPELLRYTMIYLTNAAALDQLANRHQSVSNAAEDNGKNVDDLFESLEQSDRENILNNNILNEKRNWKSMNAAWGKRRNEPQWNKFRGVWGKREPGWNNLKGMWGKRSSKDWQKLHAAWGKRAQDIDNGN